MKPNELRIGNLLKCSITGSFLSVWEIDEDGFKSIVLDRKNYPLPPGWVEEPIPLTEEILLKCGFTGGFSDCQFTIKVTKDCSMSIWIDSRNENCMVGDELELTVKYLHQLQNLYFALTGEELTCQP